MRGRPGRAFLLALAALVLAGALIRVVNVMVWYPTDGEPDPERTFEENEAVANQPGYYLWGDAYYYHYSAIALSEGDGFVDPLPWRVGRIEPSAPRPIYPAYLALWSLVGVDSITGHRLVSGLLGLASIVAIALLARRLAGDRAGLLAAAIAAFYPLLWINDGMLLSEPASILTAALALYAAYAFWDRPSLGRAAVLGVATGAAALGRSELLLLFPIAVVPLALLVRDVSWARRTGIAAVALGAGVAVVAPYVGYNMARFEEPVFLAGGSGAVLSAGACDEVFYGDRIGYYADCFPGPRPEGDESERDLVAREYAIDYTTDHLERLPIVVPARIGRVWSVYAPGQTTWLDWALEGRGRLQSWTGLFAYYALAPLAVAGLVLLRRRRIPVLPPLAIFAAVTFSAAASFGVTRYRAVAEVPIVILAAVAIDAGWRWWQRRGEPDEEPARSPGDASAPASREPAAVGDLA